MKRNNKRVIREFTCPCPLDGIRSNCPYGDDNAFHTERTRVLLHTRLTEEVLEQIRKAQARADPEEVKYL